MYEIFDINFMIKILPPKEVKVNITIDGFRLKSNLTTNKTIKVTKKYFFYEILGFTQTNSGKLGDILGFIQLIRGTKKVIDPLTLPLLIKFIGKQIVSMVV